MRREFRSLRLKQLDRTAAAFAAKPSRHVRPAKGWLRAVREATGISSSEVARALKTSRQFPLQLEKAEENDRITLKSLRAAADALGCDLVYALVPKPGSFKKLVEERERVKVRKRVASVEHSMALEDQAAGRIKDAVDTETKRQLGKRGLR
jgi:predicted DNA-binding mobile mystery protein A